MDLRLSSNSMNFSSLCCVISLGDTDSRWVVFENNCWSRWPTQMTVINEMDHLTLANWDTQIHWNCRFFYFCCHWRCSSSVVEWNCAAKMSCALYNRKTKLWHGTFATNRNYDFIRYLVVVKWRRRRGWRGFHSLLLLLAAPPPRRLWVASKRHLFSSRCFCSKTKRDTFIS